MTPLTPRENHNFRSNEFRRDYVLLFVVVVFLVAGSQWALLREFSKIST